MRKREKDTMRARELRVRVRVTVRLTSSVTERVHARESDKNRKRHNER